ncbi:MAG: hypothetical protein KH355_13145 [Clostridiales bacterium]|nr:hypothetical protein [Clostridiales bacterium]
MKYPLARAIFVAFVVIIVGFLIERWGIRLNIHFGSIFSIATAAGFIIYFLDEKK